MQGLADELVSNRGDYSCHDMHDFVVDSTFFDLYDDNCDDNRSHFEIYLPWASKAS
jgi:hypothetical protein